jgi:uncharacterized protein
MHEAGRGGGDSPLGPPRGEPEKPLLEAFIVFLAFYLTAYIGAASQGIDASRPGYHLAVLASNLPKALFLLYLMASSDGLRPFGILGIRPIDAARGLLCSLGAIALVLAPAYLFSLLGIENPLFSQARLGPRAGAGLLPLVLASSLATGYSEELFFRAFLMRRLGQGGLPPLWAAVATSLIFGAGHSYQGLVGLVSGSLIGLYFAWRWVRGGDIHEIAIGHGLFDVAAFCVLIYS